MAAGMGDVVFAPMYEVLRRRGVRFEFFHRVEALHVAADGFAIDAVTLARQARLRDPDVGYQPLVRVGGLPSFPAEPLADQLADADGIEQHDLESHWSRWPDAGRRQLRRGEDFDELVFAIPVGMAPVVCAELIERKREWRQLVDNVPTTATQALQLWFRPDEPALGWPYPGATVSAYAHPFSTWASMDQLIGTERWPADDRPGAIAYFCGPLDAPWPAAPDAGGPSVMEERVRENVRGFVEHDLAHLLPGMASVDGARWDLLCGSSGRSFEDAIDAQYLRTGTSCARPVPTATGCDPTRAASTTSTSPATGPTTV
jgi:hypothetical protein